MRSDIWENFISLNPEPKDFEVLEPAITYRASDGHGTDWAAENLPYDEGLEKDRYPLPTIADREGYYGPHHFSYWASGFRDMHNILKCAALHGTKLDTYLDIGCASGRVVRHFAINSDVRRVIGCDINSRHVDWVLRHLPENIEVFQNHSVPSLPLEDGSVDFVSAFSVFTHIEHFELHWLMELRRILRPGGLAWITVHSEHTWEELEESWPLYKGLANHPEFKARRDAGAMQSEKMVFRWKSDRSYSSNVFYTNAYIRNAWGRIMDIVEVRRRFPGFQDVVILRKRADT
ncbi:class I SAM-dependent methyltransferase [Microbaculum sp. FT89]|uniref:class I SAM-dependent methyltransferase n=1 Tax=Microbaculum sp. FT89 TaxID=3447298 RepID=UPI003F536DAE